MGLYEFIALDVHQKAQYVWNEGINLSMYIDGDHAFTLYKMPEFYAEIEFSRKENRIVDVGAFMRGWKLDKHIDHIKIDTF